MKRVKINYQALGLQFFGEARDLGFWGFDRCRCNRSLGFFTRFLGFTFAFVQVWLMRDNDNEIKGAKQNYRLTVVGDASSSIDFSGTPLTASSVVILALGFVSEGDARACDCAVAGALLGLDFDRARTTSGSVAAARTTESFLFFFFLLFFSLLLDPPRPNAPSAAPSSFFILF